MDEIIAKVETHLNFLKTNRRDPTAFKAAFEDMMQELGYVADDIDADDEFLES